MESTAVDQYYRARTMQKNILPSNLPGQQGRLRRIMIVEWTGEALGAAEILQVLGINRRTGTYQVVCDGDAYALHVQHGKIIFATSSHRTLRLGHLLLQRGAVQPIYLHDVLRGRRTIARDQALGSVLIRDGALTIEDLAAGIEEQAIEVLSRIVGLVGATYLYHGDDPMPAGIEIVPLQTDHLLQEAVNRHTSRASTRVMQRLLPSPDATLNLTVQLALVSYLLTDAELLVALHLDRSNSTLRRLEETLPLDQLTLKRSLISLLERGYVARGEPELRFDS